MLLKLKYIKFKYNNIIDDFKKGYYNLQYFKVQLFFL